MDSMLSHALGGYVKILTIMAVRYPGPAITAVKGQTLRVKVNNRLVCITLISISIPAILTVAIID